MANLRKSYPMSTYKIISYTGVLLILVSGCKKEPDPIALNNQIELGENPDPIQRVSGTYNAVFVDAGFKVGDGFKAYQEGSYSLSQPDGSIKGGGYQLTVKPAGAQTVAVTVEGSSTNFAKVPNHTIGTYTVYTVQNGSTTEYQLRKAMAEPIALLIKRYDAFSTLTSYEYDVALNYYYNKATGDFHWGKQNEIEPDPSSWFYLNGDSYTVYFKMLRKVSKS
ncbi:hypothetical protein GCM10027592_62220 [Spirosoma flavus]